MKRVLHLLNSRHFNGAERVVANIMSGLGARWDGLFVSREGPVGDVLASKGLAYRGLSGLRVSELRKVVGEYRPDLIHAHDYRASLVAAWMGIPVISHLHNNYPWAKRLGPVTVAYRAALPRFRKVIAVSPSVVDEHVFAKALRKKSRVIGNGLDFDEVHRRAEERPDPFDLVFVGRLTAQKDPLTFVRIVRALQTPECPVTAVMLGSGEMLEECRAAASDLEGVLEVRGYVENPYPFLAASKVCILPSQWEGFGMVALEAMALRTVVLGRPVGGLKGILHQISPELLCEHTEDFVVRAQDLLTNDIKRIALANRGKQIVEEQFALAHFVNQIEQVYNESIS